MQLLCIGMEPQIKDGEQILVSNIPYLFKKPIVNDIVAIRFKNKILVKRIFRIIKNKYYVRGDNKSDSLDSRKFGFIKKDNLMGKVIYKLN